jgi:hypothetical protein
MREGQDKRGAASTAAAHTVATGPPDEQYRQAAWSVLTTHLNNVTNLNSLLAAYSLQTPGRTRQVTP